MLAALVAVKYH